MARRAIAVCAIMIVTLALVSLATAEGRPRYLSWWPGENVANLGRGALTTQTDPTAGAGGASTTSLTLSVGFTVPPTPPWSGDHIVYLPLVFH